MALSVRRNRASVTSIVSLIQLRAKRQRATGQPLEVIGSGFGNDVRPLRDSSPADIQSACNMDRLLEMGDDVNFEHDRMLTIVSTLAQPCSGDQKLTLVSMEPWDAELFEDRLAWALTKSKVSQARLAEHCGISSAAVSKWMNGQTKDLKMENIFAAAELCAVSPRWLGTNEGTPFDGINAALGGISGLDIQIAKRLSKLEDKGLRKTIAELIESKEVNAASGKSARRRKS